MCYSKFVTEIPLLSSLTNNYYNYCRLVSQSGYVVVDDTNRPQFDTAPWPWVVNKTYPTPSDDQCSAVKNEQVCTSIKCVVKGDSVIWEYETP